MNLKYEIIKKKDNHFNFMLEFIKLFLLQSCGFLLRWLTTRFLQQTVQMVHVKDMIKMYCKIEYRYANANYT